MLSVKDIDSPTLEALIMSFNTGLDEQQKYYFFKYFNFLDVIWFNSNWGVKNIFQLVPCTG
jgi:hypothetical protein